jgi:3-oxoadipate enol-lactonase
VTPLVFLHGVGGGHDAWRHQVGHFGKLGYRCLAWDQPGYGGTARVEPYDLAQISHALKHYVEPHGPVVLIGHSMGGFIAQETYAPFPQLVRALALCFTSPAFGGGTAFAHQFIAARIGPLDEGKSMAEVAARVMPTMRSANSDPHGLALAERIMSQIPPETYRKALKLLTSFDRRADLARIRVPTLLVAGGDDTTAPAKVMRKMAQAIPGAEYVELEGCGHLGPMDQPEAFNRALQKFLQRHSL